MKELEEILKDGGVCITKTDTIYGILTRTDKEGGVQRVYKIKGRDEDKPFIILISDIKSLSTFGIRPSESAMKIINKSWPGPVTIIFDLPKSKVSELEYLHRGTGSLAFRLPNDSALTNVIKQTGPLVAPSANPQGEAPARNVQESKEYFGDNIDFYHNRGQVTCNKPSRILKIDGSKFQILRE